MGPGVLQVEQLRGHWEEAVSRAEHIKAAKEVVRRAVIAGIWVALFPKGLVGTVSSRQ